MRFNSINEIDKFRFDDCVLKECSIDESGITLMVEALIVKADNSQNSNYTESYAGEAAINMPGAKVSGLIRDGYRKYDADDNLIEQVEDESLPVNALNFKEMFNNQYLTDISALKEGEYRIGFEIADEDPTAITDSYTMVVQCESISVSWDRYMNRVQ